MQARLLAKITYRTNDLVKISHIAHNNVHMSTVQPPKLDRNSFPEAGSLFRSLFMEDWQAHYLTWEEAISLGSLGWSFTAEKFREIASQLDDLGAYSEAAVQRWITQVCSGLPLGSPTPYLSSLEFVRQTQILVSRLAEEWEKNGKSRRE